MNPLGTCAHPDDLALLAQACVEHDLIAICDEVWEALVYDGAEHRSLMQQPGMRERTVKIGSAGKIFGLTGWKLGWMCATPPIARVLAKAHQFLTFTSPPHLQWAVAEGLNSQDAWIATARAEHQASRDFFCAGLHAIGLATIPSAATYFVTVDLAASQVVMDDVAFCEAIIGSAGVAAIPISAFYAEAAPTRRPPEAGQALDTLYSQIEEARPKDGSATVIGYTDRIGSDAYNQDLSLRRADAVAQFLVDQGIQAQILVAGKGKSEPRQISDPAQFSQDQIDQLNRRVEFSWK